MRHLLSRYFAFWLLIAMPMMIESPDASAPPRM